MPMLAGLFSRVPHNNSWHPYWNIKKLLLNTIFTSYNSNVELTSNSTDIKNTTEQEQQKIRKKQQQNGLHVSIAKQAAYEKP